MGREMGSCTGKTIREKKNYLFDEEDHLNAIEWDKKKV